MLKIGLLIVALSALWIGGVKVARDGFPEMPAQVTAAMDRLPEMPTQANGILRREPDLPPRKTTPFLAEEYGCGTLMHIYGAPELANIETRSRDIIASMKHDNGINAVWNEVYGKEVAISVLTLAFGETPEPRTERAPTRSDMFEALQHCSKEHRAYQARKAAEEEVTEDDWQ